MQGCPIGMGSSRKSSLGTAEESLGARDIYRESKSGGGVVGVGVGVGVRVVADPSKKNP